MLQPSGSSDPVRTAPSARPYLGPQIDLCKAGELKDLLARFGIDARKGLGQHFLISRSVVESIVSQLPGGCSVLEIGPGPGVLTQAMLHVGSRVVAWEVDGRLPALLAESAPGAEVHLRDALEHPIESALMEMDQPRGVVSNLPYYITAPLVTRIVSACASWDVAVLMMQQEVADRIRAQAGDSDRGSLSVFVQMRCEVQQVCKVPPGSFLPPPKVNSSVLCLKPKNKDNAQWNPSLEKLIRSGFEQPRKTLVNNLVCLGGHRKEDLGVLLESIGLSPSVRAHQLENEQWIQLLNAL